MLRAEAELSCWCTFPSRLSDAWSCVHLRGLFLHISSFHPLTHSWSHTHCGSTAPTYCTCVTGGRPAHTHAAGAGSLEGKLNDLFFFFSVFLQEHAHLKQPEEGDGAAVCAFKEAVRHTGLSGFGLSRSLADSQSSLTLGLKWLTHSSSSLASFMFLYTC